MILNSIISMMGGGSGIGPGVGPYTLAFYNTVISRGGSFNTTEINYLSTFETSVGSDLAEFDRLWIHGLSDSVAARTSFVNPSSTIVTAVNSPTFISNAGFQGNGSTSYLHTNFNPATQGVKFTLNNASVGVYSLTDTAVIGSDMGCFNGSSFVLIQAKRESNVFNVAINDGGFNGSANTDSRGLFVGSVSSGNKKVIKNGVTLNTTTHAAVGIPSLPFYLLGWNNVGVPQLATTRQYALSFVASGSFNQSNFYTSVQALGTSIGWAV